MRTIFCFLSALGLFLPFVSGLKAEEVVNTGPRVEQFERLSNHQLGRINAIVQDKNGFIWLATRDGLLRFDGFNIRRFATANSGLPHNYVTAVFPDEHYLWLGTLSGLSRMNLRNESFDNFSFDSENPKSLDSDRVNTIQLGEDGRLWVGTDEGINLFDTQTLINTRLDSQLESRGQNSVSTEVLAMYLDRQGFLWYTMVGKGLFRYHLQSKRLQHFQFDPENSDTLDSNNPGAITQTQDGTIWVGTNTGLNRFNPDTNSFRRFEVPYKTFNKNRHINITRLLEDELGNLWIGSYYNGVSLLPKDSQEVVDVNQGGIGREDLSARFINDIYQDSDGTLWLATSRSGLLKIYRDGMLFTHYGLSSSGSERIWAQYVDSDGQLWGAVNNVLMYFDGKRWLARKKLTDAGLIGSIKEDREKRLIVAIGGQGVFKFDKVSGELTQYGKQGEDAPKLPSNHIHSLNVAEDGELWVGLFRSNQTRAGLYLYDQQHRQYRLMLPNTTVETVLPTKDYVYAGTRRKGLQIYHRQSGKWSGLAPADRKVKRVWQIFKDKQARIWLATNGNGLAQLNEKTGELTYFTTKQGLPSDSVRSITQDDQGLLWLGTVKGIVLFNPENHDIRVFDQNQGVKIGAILPRSAGITPQGEVIMADSKQFIHFSADKLKAAATHQGPDMPVMLSDFRLFNQPLKIDKSGLLKQPINYTDELVLSYEDYWFSLSFASAHYSFIQNIKYAYIVEGLTDRWVETDKDNRIASVISAPPGKYTLKVKSTDSLGNWQDEYRSLKITITPPWWLTWQAKTLYVVLALLLILAIYHYRMRALVKRAEVLERQVLERTQTINHLMSKKEQMFANISHEFKTPLTLILTPLEALLASKPADAVVQKVAMALRNGQRLLRMVEQLLELSRLDTFEQQKEHRYSLAQVLSVLLTSFNGLTEQKQLNLSCKPFDDVIVPSTLDALEMILMNLISNAIKYTPSGGIIEISVTSDGNRVTVSISDSGIGISKDNQSLVFNRFTRAADGQETSIPGAGIGLALVKELVDNHHGTIELNSEPGQGSEFIVTLPCLPVEHGIAVDNVTAISSNSANEMDVLGQQESQNRVMKKQHVSGPSEPSESKATVLLIDDNPDMLSLLNDTLKDNYNVLIADNGQKGLALAAEAIPDLIISDVMMPGMSGFEVAAKLKDEQMTCHIPVVLLTAKGDLDSRMQGWQQDIDDYLAKPFHPAELLLRVQSLLSIRRLLKRRFSALQDGELTSVDSAPVFSDKDQAFLTAFDKVLDEHYADPEFNREQAATLMFISDHQLYRKLTALLDDTFTDLLRERRLKTSVEMLKTGLQISQIADRVGFSSVPYFSKCFKARFGKTPKQYQKELVI